MKRKYFHFRLSLSFALIICTIRTMSKQVQSLIFHVRNYEKVSIQTGVSLSSAPKFFWVNISVAPKYLALTHTVRKAEVEFSVFL
jgi:hypothetical protein